MEFATLDRVGVGRYLAHRQVSGRHGFRKPDVRLFLRACEDVGVEPAACVMVGDRIDNDDVAARLLGMRTLLFRTGRHRAQQPRSWEELPDAEVHDTAGLEAAIVHLLEAQKLGSCGPAASLYKKANRMRRWSGRQ
jgi:FMN phosphatase YigB (HAD superfamily)